jgi:hypothetical protein
MTFDGPSVVGFHGLFEEDFGDPNTPTPLCSVAPSRVGSALVPFHCPRCDKPVDFSDPSRLECYRDPREGRGNCYCPACGFRFYVKQDGKSLRGKLDECGCGPCKVECPPGYVLPKKVRPSVHVVGSDVLSSM